MAPLPFPLPEGLGFFPCRSRYLLLPLRAADKPGDERTLWIDDVSVTAQKSPREGRMIDETQLAYPSLRHRLQPGESLRFTVDTEKRIGPAVAKAGGISFHRVAGWTGQPYNKQGDYTLDPAIEQAILDLRLPMTRFYAVGDEPFGTEASIDKAVELLGKVGIPQQSTVLELETQGATTSIPAADWGNAVRYSVGRGYGFRYWEVSNEPYITRADSAFQTPDEYAAHVREVSQAVRAEQPTAQVGIAINRGSSPWGNYILRAAAGAYGFVVAHHWRRAFLDNLLVTALNRAFALVEMQQVAVGIAQHLHLDVVDLGEVLLQQHVGVAEGRLGLLAGGSQRVAQGDERFGTPVARARKQHRERIDRRRLAADELSKRLEVVGRLVLPAVGALASRYRHVLRQPHRGPRGRARHDGEGVRVMQGGYADHAPGRRVVAHRARLDGTRP